MAARKHPDEFVTVVCPTCHARFSARWDQAGKRIACPDCGVNVDVPFPVPRATDVRQPKKIGEYAVGVSASAEQHREDTITVVCPTCHTRLTARWDQAGKKTICPDCGVKIRIPFPKPPEPELKPDPAKIGQYDIGEAVRSPQVETQFLDRQALIYAEVVPPPPRWTFFSGVFEFPWYRDTLPRWLYLTIGLVAWGEFVVGALSLMGVGGEGVGGIAVVGVGFMVLPIAWLSIWTYSYAASCLLAIVQETAAGNDVVGWPDETWRERVWKLLYVGYLFVLAALAGAGVEVLTRLWRDLFGIPACVTVFVLFPFMLLSSLEANTQWAPATPRILRSLIAHAWCWIVFYIAAALLAAPLVALVFFGFFRYPFLTASVAAPFMAAVILISARLLGRLAWRISEEE